MAEILGIDSLVVKTQSTETGIDAFIKNIFTNGLGLDAFPTKFNCNKRGAFMELSEIDMDWDWKDHFSISKYPSGILIKSIQFYPGASNDKLVIKQEDDTGPAIVRTICLTAAEKDIQLDMRCKPYIDFSECTLSSGHKIIFRLGK